MKKLPKFLKKLILKKRAAKIKLLALDVDGVLTDGRIYFDGNGSEVKAFNVYDGVGIKILLRAGIQVAIISGRASNAVEKRASELGIPYVFQGINDKVTVLVELQKKLALELKEIAYIGDDLPDLDVMRLGILSFAVANATAVAKEAAFWITQKAGGSGAVREVCDMILQAQNG